MFVAVMFVGCNHNNQYRDKHVEGDSWEDSLYEYRIVRQQKPKHDTSFRFINNGVRKATIEDFNININEKVLCIENMLFVKTVNGNLFQIKNVNGTYKKCQQNKPLSIEYGSKTSPIHYEKGIPVKINYWYNVGGINMVAIHGDPLGILEINELFSKTDLDKMKSF